MFTDARLKTDGRPEKDVTATHSAVSQSRENHYNLNQKPDPHGSHVAESNAQG